MWYAYREVESDRYECYTLYERYQYEPLSGGWLAAGYLRIWWQGNERQVLHVHP